MKMATNYCVTHESITLPRSSTCPYVLLLMQCLDRILTQDQLLKQLAHSKIHRTTSTALGEIQYARYVYKTTLPTDTTIRKPIATFWATRSHVLRHEAEEEFRAMCLEYPQFGFDVLSLVLDHKEQSDGSAGGVSQIATVGVPVADTPSTTRGRKRARGAF